MEIMTVLISYLLLGIAFIFILRTFTEYHKHKDFKKYGTGIPGTRSSVITSYKAESAHVESQSKTT